MALFPSDSEREVASVLLSLSHSQPISELRAADAILKLLSGGSFLDAEIRRELGDNPYINKALRSLLNVGKVKRSGKGGRQDPYIYMMA
uniref:HTH three-helical bundle domain-containing protein n=1 Tax=Fagus sylvatica TaxID=28930 RepID=A0A2N9IBA9_FAGSY